MSRLKPEPQKVIPAILLGLLLVMSDLSVGSRREDPSTPVRLAKEPHHHLRFENSYMRVWETIIPAGKATLWHVHSNDNVVITLEGASVRVETVDSNSADVEEKKGQVGFRKAPYIHRAINRGPHRFRNVAVELLRLSSLSTISNLQERVGAERILDNDRVTVYRILLTPGQSRIFKCYGSGLIVTIRQARISTQKNRNGRTVQHRFNVGAIKWNSGPIHLIKNVGRTLFEAVYIELK